MSDPSQSYASHRRYVPGYHFVLSGLLGLYLVWAIRHVIKWPTPEHGVEVMLAVAYLLIFWYLREFAKAVQDRVIRLEETLRMERLLPADLKVRIGELGVKQMVGLRFASDAELPALVRRTLDEKLGEKAIKQAVKDWRPDHLKIGRASCRERV